MIGFNFVQANGSLYDWSGNNNIKLNPERYNFRWPNCVNILRLKVNKKKTVWKGFLLGADDNIKYEISKGKICLLWKGNY